MEKEIYEEVIYDIKNLNIKDNLKKELNYFNETLQEIMRTSSVNNFNIIIDNMSKDNINILLEYTIAIIEKYGLYNEFIKYSEDNKRLDEISNSIIVIDEFSIFENKILDSWRAQERFNNFFTTAKVNNNLVIITCTNKIEDHLKDIESIIFNPKLCIHLTERGTSKELYDRLINRYQEKNIECQLSYNSFKSIVKSLDNNYYVKHFNLVDYIYDYSIKKILLDNGKIVNSKMFSDIVEKKEKKKKDINKIDNLIGLNNIKNELEGLYNYLEFSKKIKNSNTMYLNLFFLGNPGTGKTTVARMYAKKLHELGYIKENKLVEITPNDLMGKYVGHTKDAAREIFESAKGGVLFIDEAYLINDDLNAKITYMKEALVELLKYLEDPKNVVIFAGYQDKMRMLYDSNPGIKSRIYGEIIFEDYTSDELFEILSFDLQEKGLKINNKSKNKIIKYIDNLKKDINFGNARTIKQLSQKMIMNHANKKLETDNLLIDATDLPEYENNNMLKMGFGIYD